jgi:phage baseplate assembly protein W
MTRPRVPGSPRLERGHHLVGGGLGRHLTPLGQREEKRHYGALIAGVVAAVVSAAATTYASYESSQAQSEAARYQTRVAQNQAVAAQQSADQAATQDRERTKRIMAANRARLGASGIQTEGSPLLVLIDSAQQAELEARTIQAGGARDASGFLSQAALSGFYGRSARLAGDVGLGFGAGQTLLTGASGAIRISNYGNTPSSAPSQSTYGYM